MDGHISQIDVRPYIAVITEGGNILIKYSYLKLNTAQELWVTYLWMISDEKFLIFTQFSYELYIQSDIN